MASTLRLSPHHEDQLTEISKLVGTKSKNETIQKMIETYSQLKAELEKTQKLLSHTLREKHDITQKVQNFQVALEQLNTL